MVEFRPHTLKYTIVTAGYDNENGNHIGSSTTLSDPILCRYEPNSRARTIPLPDSNGEVYLYSYVVYLDNDCRSFSFGEMISLFDKNGNKVAELPCKDFQRGQLNAKLWV